MDVKGRVIAELFQSDAREASFADLYTEAVE